MYQIFYNIVYVSIIGSILGIIVLIFRKTFDKKISPTWKFVMWILVLFSLIFPYRITIQSKNSHEFIISSGIDKIEEVKEDLITQKIGTIFIYIWLTGIILLLMYYIITSIVLKIKIGKEKVKNKKILEILNNSKMQMEVKKEIELIKQKYKKVPCIYGIFKTRILITDEILEKNEESFKYILMHEIAHLKKHDLLVNKVLILILIIHWFNPVLWYCFKQIRQDMELKADEMVLDKIGKKEEKSYAKTLVKLLPISKEEKITTKVLSVTDGKKNMERRINMIKLSDKFKEYKTLIGITTLLIVLCIGTMIFTRIEPSNKEESNVNVNNIQYFETPDRIVYKEKDEDNYYVFTKGTKDYTDILNKIIEGFDSKENGIMLSQEEITNIEQNENYIELDYDTISKNYVIAYERENNNIIFRNDNGGQVVKQYINNKKEIAEIIKEKTKNRNDNCYHMKDNKEYKVIGEIPNDVFNTYLENVGYYIKQYEDGIYGGKIENKETLDSLLNSYNIQLEENIEESDFEKSDIILMISRYNIGKIETRIGGITYYFEGDKRQDSFCVNIFKASKGINTNCIYRNMENITGNISYG